MKRFIIFISLYFGYANAFISAQPFVGNTPSGISFFSNGTADLLDYDNDGDYDLSLTGLNNTAADFKLYKNNAGTFEGNGITLPSLHHTAIDWSDYDADGDLDASLVGVDNTGKSIWYVCQQINPDSFFVFQPDPSNDFGTNNKVKWIDFNNDGKRDVIISSAQQDGFIYCYQNSGNNYFRLGFLFSEYEYPTFATGELNNDGFSDFIVFSKNNNIEIAYNGAVAKYSPFSVNASQLFPYSMVDGDITSADFNGDGKYDILIAGVDNSGNSKAIIAINNGGGGFTEVAPFGILPSMLNVTIKVIDFDNNGYPDVLMGGTGFLDLYSNAGSFSFSKTSISTARIHDFTISDVDQNNALDIVWIGEKWNGSQYLPHTEMLLNQSPVVNTAPTPPSSVMAVADTGKISISWSGASDAESLAPLKYQVYIQLENDTIALPLLGNNAQSKNIETEDYLYATQSSIYLFTPGAYKGFIVSYDLVGTPSLPSDTFSFQLDSSFIQTYALTQNVSLGNYSTDSYYKVKDYDVGDFNGDGYPDIFMINDLSNDNLWLNNRSLSFNNIRAEGIQDKIRLLDGKVAAGDYNNDGLQDLVVAGTAEIIGKPVTDDNYIKIFKNISSGWNPVFTDINTPAIFNGDQIKHILWEDFDRDFDLDLFVMNESSIVVYTNTGNDNFVKSELEMLGDFTETQTPILHDLDHDGFKELILTHPTVRPFYVRTTDIYSCKGKFEWIDEINQMYRYTILGFDDIDFDGDEDAIVQITRALYEPAWDEYYDVFQLAYLEKNSTGWTAHDILGYDIFTAQEEYLRIQYYDINNDGLKDFVAVNSIDYWDGEYMDMYYFIRDDTRPSNDVKFSYINPIGVPYKCLYTVKVSDLDVDGKLDMLMLHASNNRPQLINHNIYPRKNLRPASPVLDSINVQGGEVFISWEKCQDPDQLNSTVTYQIGHKYDSLEWKINNQTTRINAYHEDQTVEADEIINTPIQPPTVLNEGNYPSDVLMNNSREGNNKSSNQLYLYGLQDGTHTISIAAVDQNGAISKQVTQTIQVKNYSSEKLYDNSNYKSFLHPVDWNNNGSYDILHLGNKSGINYGENYPNDKLYINDAAKTLQPISLPVREHFLNAKYSNFTGFEMRNGKPGFYYTSNQPNKSDYFIHDVYRSTYFINNTFLPELVPFSGSVHNVYSYDFDHDGVNESMSYQPNYIETQDGAGYPYSYYELFLRLFSFDKKSNSYRAAPSVYAYYNFFNQYWDEENPDFLIGIIDNDKNLTDDFVVYEPTSTFIRENRSAHNLSYYVNNNGTDYIKADSFQLTGKVYDLKTADLDSDGYQEVLVSEHNNLWIYYYVNGRFFKKSSGIFEHGDIDVVDIDNDGDQDILLVLSTVVNTEKRLQIYKNLGHGLFELSYANNNISKLSDCQITDHDNDGRLDLLLAYADSCVLFQLNSIRTNVAPEKITNAFSTVEEDRVTLNWDAPNDDHTTANGLSYELYVLKDGEPLITPLSNSTNGNRLVLEYGKIKSSAFRLTNLPNGNYEWRVQAIDQGYKGGEFSNVQSFTVNVDKTKNILISAVITPNGDDANDFLYVNEVEEMPENHVRVFNSWGQLVFEATNYQNDWSPKELPTGNYTCSFSIPSKDVTKNINVTILK